jgi:SAM-dependent methyltransferase
MKEVLMSPFPHVAIGHRGRALVLAAALLLALAHGAGTRIVGSAAAARPSLDVHYVPTPHEVVNRMLEIAEVQPDDYVVDLGSGDGRIVIAAVRDFDARKALGIDLDPQRVSEALGNAQEAGVSDRATFEQGNLFEKDFSDATVLTMYLLQSINVRVRPIILERMAPGTRVVSHAFDMGDWEADQHEVLDGRNIYLWIVPARVEGRWQLNVPDGKEIIVSLTQNYQQIEGSAIVDGAPTALTDSSVHGDELRFTIGSERYVGKVEGDTVTPVQNSDATQDWHARRL